MRFKTIVWVMISLSWGAMVLGQGDAQKSSGQSNQEAAEDAQKTEPPKEAEQKKVVEFAARFNRNYLRSRPRVGATIQLIDGLDEEGLPFDMDQIKGKYSVFVFGCLT